MKICVLIFGYYSACCLSILNPRNVQQGVSGMQRRKGDDIPTKPTIAIPVIRSYCTLTAEVCHGRRPGVSLENGLVQGQ